MRSEKTIDLRLIRRKILSGGLPVLIFAITASASNVTSVTPTGSSTSGPVAPSATFITGLVTLTDLEINPSNVSQLLSGLSFTLSNAATTGTLFSSTGTQVTVNSGGTYSLGTAGAAGWGLNNNVSGGVQLNALGFVGPAGLIIGAPGAGGTYSNASSSITGTSSHFLSRSVSFIIDIPGVTTVTSANFSFGTKPGQFNVKGCASTNPTCAFGPGSDPGSQVPEPVSLVLTASGLIGLFFLRGHRA